MPADRPTIATMYRNHADMIDGGHRFKASSALLIEFDDVGHASLISFDRDNGGQREGIARLLNAAAMLNAEAAH